MMFATPVPLFMFRSQLVHCPHSAASDDAIHLIVRSENTHESPIVHSGITDESLNVSLGSLGGDTWLWPQPMRLATATLNKAPTRTERDAPLETALILQRTAASTPNH